MWIITIIIKNEGNKSTFSTPRPGLSPSAFSLFLKEQFFHFFLFWQLTHLSFFGQLALSFFERKGRRVRTRITGVLQLLSNFSGEKLRQTDILAAVHFPKYSGKFLDYRGTKEKEKIKIFKVF